MEQGIKILRGTESISSNFSGFIGLLLLTFGLIAWAISSPVGASPDDDFHLVSSWCGGGTKSGICEEGSSSDTRMIPSGLISANCFAFKPDTSGSCQGNINTSTKLVETDRGSFEGNYPPVYYAFESFFASKDIIVSSLVMRIMNIFIFMFSFALLFLKGKALIRSAFFWTIATTMVPLGWFLIASNNPSSWAITGIIASFFALTAFLTSKGKSALGFAILYLFEVTISAGSRGDAGIYLSVVSVAAIILCFPFKKTKVVLPLMGSLIGILFFISTKQANVASTGLASIAIDVSGRTPIDVLVNNLLKVPALWLGAFGLWPLGWLDTYLPAVVWILSGSVFLLCISISLKFISIKQLWVAIGLIGILYLLPVYVLQQGLNLVGEQVQPRYLLPLILILAAVLFSNLGMINGPFHKRPPLNILLIVMVGISNSISLLSNLNRYVNASGNWKLPFLNNNSWWWEGLPLSPIAVWIFGSLAFGFAIYFLYKSMKTKDQLSVQII